jgi:hypothetical protein
MLLSLPIDVESSDLKAINQPELASTLDVEQASNHEQRTLPNESATPLTSALPHLHVCHVNYWHLSCNFYICILIIGSSHHIRK